MSSNHTQVDSFSARWTSRMCTVVVAVDELDEILQRHLAQEGMIARPEV